MWKGFYAIFSNISYHNNIIKTRFEKLEQNKTLNIKFDYDKCSTKYNIHHRETLNTNN